MSKELMMTLLGAVCVACSASAGGVVRNEALATVKGRAAYTNTVEMSSYGETFAIERIAVSNGSAVSATVVFEIADAAGCEQIASESVAAGATLAFYPMRDYAVYSGVTNKVCYTANKLRVRTTLGGTNAAAARVQFVVHGR